MKKPTSRDWIDELAQQIIDKYRLSATNRRWLVKLLRKEIFKYLPMQFTSAAGSVE
jgi:hypothetical protein